MHVNLGIGTTNPGAKLDVSGSVSIAATKSLAVDTINEKTAAAGVTIDGLLIKDSAIGTSFTRQIPFYVTADLIYGGTACPQLPDENANNRIGIQFRIPANWNGTSDITITTLWVANSTGNVDLEYRIQYYTGSDEETATLVTDWTNCNLSWASAPDKTKLLTTTIAAASLGVGRYFRVNFRRNTGDANTGIVELRGGTSVTLGVYP